MAAFLFSAVLAEGFTLTWLWGYVYPWRGASGSNALVEAPFFAKEWLSMPLLLR